VHLLATLLCVPVNHTLATVAGCASPSSNPRPDPSSLPSVRPRSSGIACDPRGSNSPTGRTPSPPTVPRRRAAPRGGGRCSTSVERFSENTNGLPDHLHDHRDRSVIPRGPTAVSPYPHSAWTVRLQGLHRPYGGMIRMSRIDDCIDPDRGGAGSRALRRGTGDLAECGEDAAPGEAPRIPLARMQRRDRNVAHRPSPHWSAP